LVRNGKVLYTVTPRGTLEQFDPTTKTNRVLATFPNGGPRDMVYDPGRKSVLIALYTSARLARYNFITGAVTVFPSAKLGSSLDGLAYDPAGNLYAVVSHNTICQLNPNTGAILQTLVLEPHYKVNGGDGLLYDNFTHNLWATHDGTQGNGLIEIPLTATKPPRLGSPIFRQTGKLHVPDGIITDGVGNLYIGEGLQFLTQYSIPKNAIIKRVLVKGIDSPAFRSEPSTARVP
jgi:DNA-binding beta-propeller fold protein YncE